MLSSKSYSDNIVNTYWMSGPGCQEHFGRWTTRL